MGPSSAKPFSLSMAIRLSREQLLRGFLVALDGASLWFLAVLATAYLSGALPWQSGADFFTSFRAYTVAWLSSPRVDLVDATGFLGIALTAIGPLWYWVRPWLSALKDAEVPTERDSVDLELSRPGFPPRGLFRTRPMRVWQIVKPVVVFGAVPAGIVLAAFAVTEFLDVPLRVPLPSLAFVGAIVGSFVMFFASIYLLFRVIG